MGYFSKWKEKSLSGLKIFWPEYCFIFKFWPRKCVRTGQSVNITLLPAHLLRLCDVGGAFRCCQRLITPVKGVFGAARLSSQHVLMRRQLRPRPCRSSISFLSRRERWGGENYRSVSPPSPRLTQERSSISGAHFHANQGVAVLSLASP